MQSISAGSGTIEDKGRKPARRDLAVGCFASICRDRLADELLGFSRTCPEIDIGLHEMMRGALLPALRIGDLSLAVLPGREEPGVHSAELWHDRVLVAMAPGHRLAGLSAIRPAELLDEIFLVSRQQFGSDMHRFLAQRILPLGPTLNATISDLGPPRIIERVAAGDGIALISSSHAEHAGPAVVLRPIEAVGALFPVRAYWTAPEPDWPLSGLIRSLKAGARPFGTDP
jgi:DNA-binding transcriptional LysR family regulator